MPLELVLIAGAALIALVTWAATTRTRRRAKQAFPDISHLFEFARPSRGALELGGVPGRETVCFVTGRPPQACGCPHHQRRSA